MKNINILKTSVAIFTACVIASFVFVSCSVPVVIHNPDGTAATNHIVDPRLTQALETAAVVNAATSPVNPWTYPIGIAISAVGGIATWWVKRKDAPMLASIIKGVEIAGNDATKAAIKKQAISDGTETSLSKAVQGMT